MDCSFACQQTFFTRLALSQTIGSATQEVPSQLARGARESEKNDSGLVARHFGEPAVPSD